MVTRSEVPFGGRLRRPTVDGAYTCACLAAGAALLVAGHLALAAVVLVGVALHLLLADTQR